MDRTAVASIFLGREFFPKSARLKTSRRFAEIGRESPKFLGKKFEDISPPRWKTSFTVRGSDF